MIGTQQPAGGAPLAALANRRFRSGCANHTRLRSGRKRRLMGCRIPSVLRRVREKESPITGFASPSFLVSDSLLTF
jgi:hypothetical protein